MANMEVIFSLYGPKAESHTVRTDGAGKASKRFEDLPAGSYRLEAAAPAAGATPASKEFTVEAPARKESRGRLIARQADGILSFQAMDGEKPIEGKPIRIDWPKGSAMTDHPTDANGYAIWTIDINPIPPEGIALNCEVLGTGINFVKHVYPW